jgi:chromosome segregation ATPase
VARSGLDKSDVKKARDDLIALAQYPSVDAVRIALGNTGSKTTIHKYLKELEEEKGGGARKSSISDALQDLVQRLAARLQEEADLRVAAVSAEYASREQQHVELEKRLRIELADARAAAGELEARLKAEIKAHTQSRAALQGEIIARHTAEQLAANLKERLTEMQTTAAVKQAEAASLSQETAKLAADLAHARLAAYEAQRMAREQEAKLEQVPMLEQKLRGLREKLAGKEEEIQRFASQLQLDQTSAEQLTARVRELELDLAGARATADGQLGLAAELRRMLDGYSGNSGNSKPRAQRGGARANKE